MPRNSLIGRGGSCRLALALLLAGLAWSLLASDEQARAEFALGQERLQAGDPEAAGGHFEKANFYADDPVLKANALKAAAAAFVQCRDPIREASALRELTANFPGQADYAAALQRQYDLASADYRQAQRQAGSWFPWHGQAADRAIAAYESLLEQAQFADFTPDLRVRLGRLYLQKNRVPEALQQWRETIRQHPGGPAERHARFELANALLQLAANGDGDGAYGREAQEGLRQILELYPDDPDTAWARDHIRQADTFAAQRLYHLAEFYRHRGNHEAAIRYLHELLAAYPKSPVAGEGEILLAELDADYRPPAKPVPGRNEPVRYPRGKLPEAVDKVLVPDGQDGRWLLPVEDLGTADWKYPDPDGEQEAEDRND